MTRNVGSTDRIIRFVLGIALIALGIYLNGTDAGTLGLVVPVLVGLVLIVTGALNFCPIWAVVGINTIRGEKK
ncbi:MAG: DUF2892 domain-containing protein [Anaerolineae bacterium]|nr:DUF2892 domain-containing protein [Anaerolineae bacterium]